MKATTTNSHELEQRYSLTSLARLVVVLAMASGPIATQAALVAHWTFDESSGPIAHDSAGSFNGNLSPSGAAFVAGGISGNALSLNKAGGGFVNMGNVLGFTSQPFSIVAWIKTAPGYSVSDSAVVSKHQAFSTVGYWFMANQAGGGGQVGKVIFGEGTAAKAVTSTTTVNDGNWHQIVSTWQPGGNMRVYVDGAPAEATNAASAILNATAAPLLIGAVNAEAISPRYTGLIDDVQIYNHALSDGEVDFLFQHPGQATPPLAGVVAHWTFDESGGSIAHDSAGTLNGTLSSDGAAFVAGGISGNAVRISRSGNGTVNMGNVLGLTTGDFSLVVWVKMNAGDTTINTVALSKHAAFSNNGYEITVNMAGGGGQANKSQFYEGTIAGSPVSTTSVNDGTWHQIVGVYRAGAQKLIYVDGAPPEDVRPSQTFLATTAPFLIGGDTEGGNPVCKYDGLIDDVQIYNYALSDGDVNFLFQHPGQVAQGCSQQLADVQAQLAAANNANATLQAQLTTCNTALMAANQNNQNLQNEILDLLLPLQLLTQDFRTTFHDPQFQIRGGTAVEQMQNLVVEILDLPRGQQHDLFLKLGGDKNKGVNAVRDPVSSE